MLKSSSSCQPSASILVLIVARLWLSLRKDVQQQCGVVPDHFKYHFSFLAHFKDDLGKLEEGEHPHSLSYSRQCPAANGFLLHLVRVAIQGCVPPSADAILERGCKLIKHLCAQQIAAECFRYAESTCAVERF